MNSFLIYGKVKIKIFECNEFLSRLEKECKGGGKSMETKTKVRIMGIILAVAVVLIETAAAKRINMG